MLKTKPPSLKTLRNILSGHHDARISHMGAIAQGLDCPLWLVLLPNLKTDDLESPRRERLIALMRDYLRCDSASRSHVENMAAAFAAKQEVSHTE